MLTDPPSVTCGATTSTSMSWDALVGPPPCDVMIHRESLSVSGSTSSALSLITTLYVPVAKVCRPSGVATTVASGRVSDDWSGVAFCDSTSSASMRSVSPRLANSHDLACSSPASAA